MKREIIDGYLYEVTKSLSRKDRKAVYEKLDKEIYEKIEERKKGPVETKEEILSVLEEYGNPADVAQRYAENGNKALVPQPHYSHYQMDKNLGYIVGLVFYALMVFFSFTFFKTISFRPEEVLLIGVDILSIIFVVYVVYTLSFSWVSGSRLKSWDKFSKTLKPEPSKSSKVSAFEMKFQVVFGVIIMVTFGFLREMLAMTYEGIDLGNGYMILFTPLIILAYFFNTLNLAYKEVDRKYTGGVLATTIISNLIIMALAFFIFIKEDAISQGFRSWLAGVLPTNDLMAGMVNNLGMVVFFIVVIIASIDTIATALGFHSNKKDSVEGIYQDDFGKEEKIKEEKIKEEVDQVPTEVDQVPTEVEPVVSESPMQTTVIEDKIDPLKAHDPVLMPETSDSEAPEEDLPRVHPIDEILDDKIDPLKSTGPVLMAENIESEPGDQGPINPDDLIEDDHGKVDPLKEVDTEFDPLGELDPENEHSIFNKGPEEKYENTDTIVIDKDQMKKAQEDHPTIAEYMKENKDK